MKLSELFLETKNDLEQVYELIRGGKTAKEAAKTLGIIYSTLLTRIKAAGGWPEDIKKILHIRRIRRAQKIRPQKQINLEQVYELIRGGKTAKEAAKTLDTTYGTLRKKVKKAGGWPEDIKKTFYKQRGERMKSWWDDPEHGDQRKQKHAQITRAWWDDPEHGDQRKQDFGQKHSKFMKSWWDDPEHGDQRKQELSKRRKEWWKHKDFWEWLATFPTEKRINIIKAMMIRNKELPEETKQRMTHFMIEKARNL